MTHDAPPPQETRLRTVVDADFGPMTLIRRTFSARNGPRAPWTTHAYCEWRAPLPLHGEIRIDATEQELAPNLPPALRAAILARLSAEPALRAQIGADMRDIAEHWAESAERPAPDAARLAALLRLDAIAAADDRFTFWYAETGDIFAGHMIEVRFDQAGMITEMGLAG